MTVQTQIQQCIASAQSVEASLTQFSLETENQQAKQMFEQLAQQQKTIVSQLEGRYQQVLQEEPQFNQSQNQSSSQAQNQMQASMQNQTQGSKKQ
ncbi:DUF1657 domain-containing protein [Bacillus horti]|uniref:Protease II n=1 Tax=Caldalkalibacillus horti TaxID=77523 RepID=A0ABT9VX54_9BACI|nr:protease II [Bacillus horti]